MRTSIAALRAEHLAGVLGDRGRVIHALDAAFRWSDRTSVLEQAVFRIAQLLKSDLSWPKPDTTTGPHDAVIIAFVEQWIIDIASMSDSIVTAVRDALGDDGLRDFVHSLLVIEQRIRLELAWQRLGFLPVDEVDATVEEFHRKQWGSERTGGTEPERRLTAALSEWQAAVVCLDEVDPITTELVRLRCANYHDCHT